MLPQVHIAHSLYACPRRKHIEYHSAILLLYRGNRCEYGSRLHRIHGCDIHLMSHPNQNHSSVLCVLAHHKQIHTYHTQGHYLIQISLNITFFLSRRSGSRPSIRFDCRRHRKWSRSWPAFYHTYKYDTILSFPSRRSSYAFGDCPRSRRCFRYPVPPIWT